ncbi:unnamed protein product, partial [Laminaria digitata]
DDDAEKSDGSRMRAGSSITVGVFGVASEGRQRQRVSPPSGADKFPLLPPPLPPPPPPLSDAPTAAEPRVAIAAALTRRQKLSSDLNNPPIGHLHNNLRLVARFATAGQPSKVSSSSSEGREDRGRRQHNDRGLPRDAPGGTQVVVAAPPAECPSAAAAAAEVSTTERETTIACADRSTTATCTGHPRVKLGGPSGLRVDTSWGKTPVAPSTALRGT